MKQYKSVFLISEDYWAIWLGAFFLLFSLVVYVFIGKQQISESLRQNQKHLSSTSDDAPFHTIAYYRASDNEKKLNSANTYIGLAIATVLETPRSWKENPLHSLVYGGHMPNAAEQSAIENKAMEVKKLEITALNAEEAARHAGFASDQLNNTASIAAIQWHQAHAELQKLDKRASRDAYNQLPGLILLALLLAVIFGVGAHFMGERFLRFGLGFLGIFALAVLSYLLAGQSDMKNMGISYAIWAIVLGLIVSNTIGTPTWMKPALKTEYYIKTGLVLLGSEILINKIMAIGLPGIFVSWVVTPIVLVTTFWFGQKILKIGSKTLNITISADMSVCGVSAAIATAAACNAKKKNLLWPSGYL